jgi:hypothetical protein
LGGLLAEVLGDAAKAALAQLLVRDDTLSSAAPIIRPFRAPAG